MLAKMLPQTLAARERWPSQNARRGARCVRKQIVELPQSSQGVQVWILRGSPQIDSLRIVLKAKPQMTHRGFWLIQQRIRADEVVVCFSLVRVHVQRSLEALDRL